MKVRLQIGVATVFALLTTIVLSIVVAVLYFGNRELALRTAHDDMIEARTRSVENMLATIRETAHVVGSLAKFVEEFPEQAKSLSGLHFMNALAQGNDHYYGLYFGVEETGAFYQNVILPSAAKEFGPGSMPVPATASRVLRIIDGPTYGPRETYFWSGEDNGIDAFHEGSSNYDPRERPWYRAALESDEIHITRPYMFESTGRPGITFAKRIVDGSGNLFGVAAIDITMSSLSRILEEIRIGEHGLVFMLDSNGKLISYTGTRSSGEGATFLTHGSDEGVDIHNAVIGQAILHWREDQETFFHFSPPGQREDYVASIAAIPEVFGSQPTLGLAVPEEEFVGAINHATTRALQISGLVLVIAVLSTIVVARLLSANLKRVTEQARRISNFELGEELNLRTIIQEVSDLENAMTSMKAGLASFGAYVPKELVRSIVSTGEMTGVGGTSREVTLLFSDLQGFTASTENLEPEQLMPALSQYFEMLETRIAENAGNVDKYIGDAIMAIWNAPLDDTKHAENACRAALACLHAEKQLNETNKGSSPLVPLHTRFGVHTGRVIVGNVGSLSRMQYTALGAAVNLASRLEGLNKVYGTRVLVSEEVVREVSDIFVFREVDIVAPAGTSKPIKIFELVGETDNGSPYQVSETGRRIAKDWDCCYTLYKARRWNDARLALRAYRDTADNKVIADIFIQRCDEFILKPPADDWDGVHFFKQK